ncbi:uncharacterized protein LOC132701306 isoform X2 [Cylas formicarius]|uniref:uncharacterized protein LOC132701306 isoform X2 n=1 Tax=Cylas formicarius TaxID=197179 RepID=UPI002958BFD2|nr:uncharacterized protein LOC132701306 isoform X2 [Cylas formicarius]
MGFFQSIKARYGNEAVSLLKQWARLGSKLSSFGNRKIFLLKCRQTGIIPRHITDGTRNLGMLLDLTDGHMGDRIRDFNTRNGVFPINKSSIWKRSSFTTQTMGQARQQTIIVWKQEDILTQMQTDRDHTETHYRRDQKFGHAFGFDRWTYGGPHSGFQYQEWGFSNQ